MKIYLNYFLIIIIINSYKCIGLTNFKKIEGGYVINIASEDLKMFEQKLIDRSVKVKNEFTTIIIKAIITSILFYIMYLFIFIRIFNTKFHIFIIFTILCSCLLYIYYNWNDYKFGIRSAENALSNFYLAMENHIDLKTYRNKNNKTKLKKVFLGDEIEKYGIHALFCEIPGTLPSNNANPESILYNFGGFCYNYDSQRRFLDPTSSDYVGDEESNKYRKIQSNKTFDLF